MNIGIAVQHNFPVDREVRTRRFAKLLNEEGADVTILAQNTTEDPARGTLKKELDPSEEQLEYAIVSRFSWLAQTRLGGVIRVGLPVNPFWFLWLYFNFRKNDLDAVIACGLRVGLPSIVAGKIVGVPVIIDVRENYPAFAETVSKDGLFDEIAYNRRVVDLLERVTLRLADGAIVVADVRVHQLVNKGIDPECIFRVMNVPLLSESRTEELLNSEIGFSEENEVRLVYLGIIRETRGLQTIIRSLPAFDDSPISVRLEIAGDGPYLDDLKELARQLDVRDQVGFEGYIESEETPQFLNSGTIGVIPHKPNDHANSTISNKVFSYMCAGLPIVATETPPIQDLFSTVDCGTTIPPNPRSADVQKAITSIIQENPEQKARNGRQAIMKTYNWKSESQPLLELLEEEGNS